MKTQLLPVDQVGNIAWLLISERDNTGCCAVLKGTLAKAILEKRKNLCAVLCSSLTHKCCEVTGKKTASILYPPWFTILQSDPVFVTTLAQSKEVAPLCL